MLAVIDSYSYNTIGSERLETNNLMDVAVMVAGQKLVVISNTEVENIHYESLWVGWSILY